MRKFGQDKSGSGFNDATINAVWNKGTPVPGKDSSWRKDACGATMRRSDHGNTSSTHGWEIDHIKPVSGGGTDDLGNLQPLQWQNNRAKADGPLKCEVST
jgi:hypothetical protein